MSGRGHLSGRCGGGSGGTQALEAAPRTKRWIPKERKFELCFFFFLFKIYECCRFSLAAARTLVRAMLGAPLPPPEACELYRLARFRFRPALLSLDSISGLHRR